MIERSELTSGSTWHAAGGFHTLNADPNIAALQGYTIELYKELEEISGQSCGLHHVGGITLATTPERMDYLKAERAKHRYMGLDTRIVGPEEIRELSPIVNTDGVLGALYDPLDGHLDPSGTTHAYAKAARQQGAQIVLRNPVKELNPQADGTWQVVTEQGTVKADYVVNAAGLWAREVGAMAGIYLPLHPMEHQYLVTDDIAEVYERSSELPHVMDPAGETYLRQEGRGLVLGIYEQDCVPWAVDGTAWDFGHELLPDDLDRIAEPLEQAYKRYPCLEEAGLKRVINGPFTFAPDGNPLVGPVPGLPGFWSACGVMAGFSQGGGVGLTLAEWMIEGEPSRDVFAMDVARFGDYCTHGYTRTKVVENYQRRFAVSYPNEELPAGRPYHTTPAYGLWDQKTRCVRSGLRHGACQLLRGPRASRGLRRRASGARTRSRWSVRNVGPYVRAWASTRSITSVSTSSPGRRRSLGSIGSWPTACRMKGRITLTPMLSPKGKLIGDFTVAKLGPERFQLTASYAAQGYHMRWFPGPPA